MSIEKKSEIDPYDGEKIEKISHEMLLKLFADSLAEGRVIRRWDDSCGRVHFTMKDDFGNELHYMDEYVSNNSAARSFELGAQKKIESEDREVKMDKWEDFKRESGRNSA